MLMRVGSLNDNTKIKPRYDYAVLAIALLPLFFVFGDIASAWLSRQGDLNYYLTSLVSVSVAFPAIAVLAKFRRARHEVSLEKRLGIKKFIVAAYAFVFADLFFRYSASGSFDKFLLDLILPRGAKSWQLEMSDINSSSFDLLGYSSLIQTSICGCYVAYYRFSRGISLFSITPLLLISLIFLSDFNRLQTFVAFIAIYTTIPGKKLKKILVLVSVPILILQGSIRGDAEAFIDGVREVEIQSFDKSYLGITELIDKADFVGGVVDTGNIIGVSVAYYIPRFLWSEKPAPKPQDWSGMKESWVAAGLFVELSLMLGIAPAIILYFTFYLCVAYFILRSDLSKLSYYVIVVSTLIVLLWAPRSFHSFIQFSPIIVFAGMINLFVLIKFKINEPMAKSLVSGSRWHKRDHSGNKI